MVAIVIGAVLLGGAISLFITNRETYNVTSDLARVQESARFAVDMMVSDLRMAGYFGCVDDVNRVTESATVVAGADALWSLAGGAALEGVDNYAAADTFAPSGSAVPDNPTDDAGAAVAAWSTVVGSDAVMLRYIRARLPAHQVTGSTGNTVTVNSAADFAADQIIGVADCGAAEIMQVDSIAGTTLTLDDALGRAYSAANNPVAAPMVAVRYYVAANAATGETALFRDVLTGNALRSQRLFDGVENLQFLYGVDTNGDRAPDAYLKAGEAGLQNAGDWSRVVSVRLAVLLRTLDAFGTAREYVLPPLLDQTHGNNNGYNDGFRRRVFTTTAAVRNLG